jgi:hypothetical protein
LKEEIMADTSERIIILTAVVLVVIIVWISTITPIVSLDDVRIELETEKGVYEMDESIEVKVYLNNEKPFAVKINTNIDKVIEGYTPEREPSPASLGHGFPVVYSMIPPNSRIEFHSTMLTPKYSGEYLISCLGANKRVQILDPPSEGELVTAMMNKHSFQSTDDATLFITNVGINLITWGSPFTIEREVDQNWIEVSYPSNFAWTAEMRLLPPNHTSSQKNKIDKLESGLYRVSKIVEDSVTQESITLFVEFEILEG